MMQYRTMLPSDYPEIITLSRCCEGVRFTESEDHRWHTAFLKRNPEMCFVAMGGDAIQGFVYCGSDGRRATIYHLAVSSACRREGVGSHLMSLVDQSVSSIGIQRAQLMVFRDNVGAIEFYKKEGWRLRDELSVMSKEAVPVQQVDPADRASRGR
jgi:ribosomal protein S18 acetylase RimI-like enzyme